MLKKIACVFLSMVLMVSASSINVKAKQNELLSVPAKPMYVDNEGKSLRQSSGIVNANILNMNGDFIIINGFVGSASVRNKFNISGSLFKSENSNNLIIGELIDKAVK